MQDDCGEAGFTGPVDSMCRILIVDDDPVCLAEYEEIVDSLGYDCVSADSATGALQLIAADQRIGIVMTDLRMPGIDGLALLDELSERFLGVRPLVAIVVTGDPSLNSAISAMRSNAIDFLSKPVALPNLSASLRRATSRWVRLAARSQLSALQRDGTKDPEPGQPAQNVSNRASPSREDLQAVADWIVRHRRSRTRFFDPELLTGPAWDILLDLAAAGLKGEKVATSSACASTQVPLSTALRHVNQLVEAGLVKRELDARDRRRTLLELEPQALELMVRFLASSWESRDPWSK